MAQRASGFARRPASGTRAQERARSATEPTGEPIPLDLVSLVAPYRRYRGLSVRVERLMHGARLSEGRNNGDRSWSLSPDELDGLEYLPAHEFYEAHTLAVRIITLEGGDGETLTVIDLPIAGRACGPEDAGSTTASGALSGEVQRLRDELVKVKSSLAARETDLATVRRQAEDAERSRQSLKAEFSAAEEAWDRGLREQLAEAAAEAEAALERARTAWEAEQSSRTSRSSTSAQKTLDDARKRWQLEAQAALAKAQAEWKVAEVARLSAAEASWRAQAEKSAAELRARTQQAENALAQAQSSASANAAPAKNNDAELRRLREQLVSVQATLSARVAELAETRATAELARSQAQQGNVESDAELKRLREQLAAVQATLAARGAELAEARDAAEHARNEAKQSSADSDTEARRLREQLVSTKATLAARNAELAEAHAAVEHAQSQARQTSDNNEAAEQSWKAAEAARLATAEARWKAQSAKALAEVNTRLEAAETALAEARAQAEARQHQINALQAAVTARDADLVKARSAAGQARARSSKEADQARQRWQEEMAAAIADAQEGFKAGEAARFAAAEAQWKAQFAPALAETTARLQEAESALAQAQAELQVQASGAGDELRRVRDELAALEMTLVSRENELSDARTAAERARITADQALQSVAAELEKARLSWKRDADAALAKAEKQWHADEAPRLAAAEAKLQEQMAARLQNLEDRLQQATGKITDEKACSEALRYELAAAHASLNHREIELAEAQAMLEQERDRLKQVPVGIQDHTPAWQLDAEERKAQFRRRLIRDGSIVACLFALAFMLFPRVQPVVAESWPRSLSLGNNFQPLLHMAGLSSAAPVSTTAVASAEPHATVRVRIANLREQPSKTAAVVTRLARNMDVVPMERRGNWVFVRIGEGAGQKQGWVSSAVLTDSGIALPPGN
ncbi:MAG: SH3 domain-containing protein [Alphaproteobacteria bacterium]|nr:SH3 domain-containing protein [Alphaproteobacteria bacterium]